jgi:hypothetical protein
MSSGFKLLVNPIQDPMIKTLTPIFVFSIIDLFELLPTIIIFC